MNNLVYNFFFKDFTLKSNNIQDFMLFSDSSEWMNYLNTL